MNEKKISITKGVHASNQHLWQALQWPLLHHPSFPFPNKSQPYPQSTKVSILCKNVSLGSVFEQLYNVANLVKENIALKKLTIGKCTSLYDFHASEMMVRSKNTAHKGW